MHGWGLRNAWVRRFLLQHEHSVLLEQPVLRRQQLVDEGLPQLSGQLGRVLRHDRRLQLRPHVLERHLHDGELLGYELLVALDLLHERSELRVEHDELQREVLLRL